MKTAARTHLKHLTTHSLSAVSSLGVVGAPHSPEQVAAHLQATSDGTRIVAHRVRAEVADWHHQPGLGKKISRPVYGSMPWLNLVFGESVALFLQGIAQSKDASNLQSFTIGLVAALVVELLATIPAAWRYKETRPAASVMNAALTGFWLGGAMGANNEKLPPRQALVPIGAYMIYGALLAGLAEYDNVAEKFVDHPEIVIPILLAWGLLKKTDELFAHEGLTERIAGRTVKAAAKLRKSPVNRDKS